MLKTLVEVQPTREGKCDEARRKPSFERRSHAKVSSKRYDGDQL